MKKNYVVFVEIMGKRRYVTGNSDAEDLSTYSPHRALAHVFNGKDQFAHLLKLKPNGVAMQWETA